MCVQNQYSVLPLDEVWGAYCSRVPFEESIFVVIKGYLDESVDDEWFTLALVMSTGIGWTWLKVDWDNCITRWSSRMVASGRKPLSRYHGTDCAGRNGEFEGWRIDEQQDFLVELRGIVERTEAMHAVSFSVRPKELKEVFGIKAGKEEKRACYHVLLQYLMLSIGNDINSRNISNLKITFIHDHTRWYDAVLNRAFFELMGDPSFRYKDCFVTIAPMRWQDATPLQAADMVAFETRK